MSVIIQDGTGQGYHAQVDVDNRLQVRAIQESESKDATSRGDSFNINTNIITLTSGSESGVLYIKNNSVAQSLHIDTVILRFGPSTGGAASEEAQVSVYRLPTAGTLISNATSTNVNNRNFSTAKTLDADVYEGTEGSTISGGNKIIAAIVQDNTGVVFVDFDVVLEKGADLAISIQPQSSNTSMKCIAALACHLET